MDYWYRWIGDWKRKTSHLSLEQKGVYNELLDHFYATEQPLPEDIDALCRLAGAQTDSEIVAVKYVIARFWKRTEQGYINDKALEQLQWAQDKRGKASAAARTRWGKNGATHPSVQTPDWRRSRAQGDPGSAERPSIKCAGCGKVVFTWTDRLCDPCWKRSVGQ